MAPHLPVEVLSLVVDELASSGRGPWRGLLRDIKSCCLAAKVFVPLCQQYIFYSVDMHPPRTILQYSNITVPGTTTSFIQLLAAKPHLGVYVRKLQYLARITLDARNGIREAFLQMPNIIEFDIDLYNHPGTHRKFARLSLCPAAWRDAILSIIARPTLEKLNINNLVFPADILAPATGLRDLRLNGCWSGFVPGYCCEAKSRWRDILILCQTKSTVFLKRIDADARSLVETGIVPHTGSPAASCSLGLSQVEEIKLRIDVINDLEHAELFLMRTQALRKLTLNINVSVDDQLPAFPLARLNRSSFLFLTDVTLHFSIDFESGNGDIFDPYLGFCETTLSQINQLERLYLDLELSNVKTGDFNTIAPLLWRKLGEVIAPLIPGLDSHYLALEKLKDVLLRVQILPSVKIPPNRAECVKAARNMCKYIQGPDAYAGLIEVARQGLLMFSVAAEVVERFEDM